jgi:hypothetical protein
VHCFRSLISFLSIYLSTNSREVWTLLLEGLPISVRLKRTVRSSKELYTHTLSAETLMLYENFLSGTFPDALRKLVKLSKHFLHWIFVRPALFAY